MRREARRRQQERLRQELAQLQQAVRQPRRDLQRDGRRLPIAVARAPAAAPTAVVPDVVEDVGVDEVAMHRRGLRNHRGNWRGGLLDMPRPAADESGPTAADPHPDSASPTPSEDDSRCKAAEARRVAGGLSSEEARRRLRLAQLRAKADLHFCEEVLDARSTQDGVQYVQLMRPSGHCRRARDSVPATQVCNASCRVSEGAVAAAFKRWDDLRLEVAAALGGQEGPVPALSLPSADFAAAEITMIRMGLSPVAVRRTLAEATAFVQVSQESTRAVSSVALGGREAAVSPSHPMDIGATGLPSPIRAEEEGPGAFTTAPASPTLMEVAGAQSARFEEAMAAFGKQFPVAESPVPAEAEDDLLEDNASDQLVIDENDPAEEDVADEDLTSSR